MNLNRRRFLQTSAAALAAPSLVEAASEEPWEWSSYASDPHSTRYAPLDQINAANVSELEVAWELETLPPRARARGVVECTPIVVDGVMFVSAHGLHSHAIEAHSGKVIWKNTGLGSGSSGGRAAGVSRGLTYWSDGKQRRLFAPVREHILAIDAADGKLIDSFGSGGAIDVGQDIDRENPQQLGSTTPGAIWGDLLIITSRTGEGPRPAAPGHIRAYDVRTGKRAWIFHTIPHPGEYGYETWSEDSWKVSGGANCWGGMSVDHERGYVYVATGSPAFDFWGGRRKGKNLFGNSILCLKAETGERVWHFQTVHHDLWDYDIPCAPNLVTVMHEGKPREIVAQVSKTGWVYMLDRDTGEPLYPIEERSVPTSDVSGEEVWPTQPFVTKPPAFSRQGISRDEVSEVTPEAKAFWKERLEAVRFGEMFTPPGGRETICFPGYHGGALWGGASWVADQGVMYVNSNEIPWSLQLVDAESDAGYPLEHTGYIRIRDEQDYPVVKPPWGLLSAIDLDACKILWQVPLGEYKELSAKGVPPTGTYIRGGNIATKGRLLFSAGGLDNVFRAFSQKDGKTLWEHELGGIGLATPCSYEADGRQFVVIASSPSSSARGTGPKAGFSAFALPR